MARHFLISTLILSLSPFTTAWQQTDLTLNLAWPPLQGEGTITVNGGHLVGPDSDFPCATIPVPDNVVRTPFPIDGGRLQYTLTNSTVAQSRDPNWSFISNSYLGQFSDDTTVNKSGWINLDTEVYEGYQTGSQCGYALNLTQRFLYDSSPSLTLSSKNLIGVNVTLGLRIVLFGGPLGDDNEEEMFQCSYLTLTSPDAPITESRGVCNRGPSPSSTSTSSPASQITSSVPGVTTSYPNGPSSFGSPSAPYTTHPISSSTATAIPPLLGASPPPSSHTELVTGLAIAIPVTVVSLAAIIATFMILRRRKAKGKPTIALDFWVRGVPGDESARDEKKEKNKAGVVEKEKTIKRDARGSESESIHSEPLPVYHREGQ